MKSLLRWQHPTHRTSACTELRRAHRECEWKRGQDERRRENVVEGAATAAPPTLTSLGLLMEAAGTAAVRCQSFDTLSKYFTKATMPPEACCQS